MEKMGPYKLDSVLGRGGMGTVYEATNEETGEQLAVKVLAPAYSADEHFRNRFESEIDALLKLDHPNIVRLISYGQEDSNLYFAMELVRGKSLFQLQRDKEKFDWREVIRIAKNVALGLRHAHDRGVIHRDLKPGNLLRADEGIIKITDFGIAKRFGQDQNTGTNVLGTVDFMSPEQAKGQPVTFRSDLYSLGNVMFTLLAGRPPFTSNSFEESMRNLTKVPAPRIVQTNPHVPEGLDELIAELLSKNPEERIQTAQSLYHQLKKVEQDLLSTSRAETAERAREMQQENDSSNLTFAGSREPSTSVDKQRVAKHTKIEDPDKFLERQEFSADSDAFQPTRKDTKYGRDRNEPPVKRDDFYNRVTDDQRKPESIGESESGADQARESSISRFILGGLLAAVLGLLAYGFYASNRTASAEELIAKIDSQPHAPQRSLKEIECFLKNYSEHERFDEIAELNELAKCNQLINRLHSTPASHEFTQVERSFLDIVKLGKKDQPLAAEKLKAFLALNESRQDLAPDDCDCVKAASAYVKRLESQAKEKIASVRMEIENQIKRAEGLPDDQAATIYDSIIKLNGEFSWANDLIQDVRARQQKLK